MTKIEQFWKRFLENTNRLSDVTYVSAFHFELTQHLADSLLDLVLKGQKKATASSLYAYEVENDRIPKIGDLNIVTNWDGHPRCVIKTQKVSIIPFKDITYEVCKREGEDENLESWQQGHRKFFTAEGKLMGYTFTEDLPVVFEDFEVIYAEDETV